MVSLVTADADLEARQIPPLENSNFQIGTINTPWNFFSIRTKTVHKHVYVKKTNFTKLVSF